MQVMYVNVCVENFYLDVNMDATLWCWSDHPDFEAVI